MCSFFFRYHNSRCLTSPEMPSKWRIQASRRIIFKPNPASHTTLSPCLFARRFLSTPPVPSSRSTLYHRKQCLYSFKTRRITLFVTTGPSEQNPNKPCHSFAFSAQPWSVDAFCVCHMPIATPLPEKTDFCPEGDDYMKSSSNWPESCDRKKNSLGCRSGLCFWYRRSDRQHVILGSRTLTDPIFHRFDIMSPYPAWDNFEDVVS